MVQKSPKYPNFYKYVVLKQVFFISVGKKTDFLNNFGLVRENELKSLHFHTN